MWPGCWYAGAGAWMRPPDAPSVAETIALGLLQGPAELLPISSSAHVELVPWLVGLPNA